MGEIFGRSRTFYRTVINEYYAKKFCCEDISLIENYAKAIADKKTTWHCHHRGEILPCGRYTPEDLKKFGLYYSRPANELIFLTQRDHNSLHHKGRSGKPHSEEVRKKMSAALKGRHHSEQHRKNLSAALKGRHHSEETRKKLAAAQTGKHLSEETRRKISAACKGKDPWNKGVKQTDDVKSKIVDSIRGRKWYNDGIRCYHLREDDPKITQLGLKLGRLKKRGPDI